MAVLAEYRDVEPPGNAVRLGIQAYETGASIMERKQRMRLREQQLEQEKAEFIAKMPLIAANARLSIVNAEAAVKNATTIANLESRAAVESTQANQEFLDAIQYNEEYDVPASDGTPEGDAEQAQAAKYATESTLKARAAKLSALSTKYSYMKLLPQYKGFVDTVEKEASQAHVATAATIRLEEMTKQAESRRDAALYGADRRVDQEQIRAGAKRDTAQGYQASRERIEALRSDTKLTLQEREAKIAAEKQGASLNNLLGRAAEADQAAAEASAAGDEQTAAEHRRVASTYRDAAQKSSTFAGQAPLAVPETSPGVRAKPAAPDSSPPAEVSITIPGSDEAPSNAPLANPPEEAAPTPTPTEAATKPETSHPAPIKVRDWNQAKALKPGTKYVGPDGILYTRGK